MKVGVIGTGSMGKNHARIYATLTDQCELVGVYDVNRHNAAAVAEQYGVTAFTSLQALLDNVEAVSIAVPTDRHYEVGMQCIAQKVHMLMEKPITETAEQAKSLIKAAKEQQIVMQVGHIELFNPVVKMLNQLIAREKIVSVEMRRLRPLEPRLNRVDVVSDTMIHDIYILFQLLGRKIDEVYAAGKQHEGVTKYAAAFLKFSSGEVAQLTASFWSSEMERTIRVVTRKHVFTADLLKNSLVKSSLLHSDDSKKIPIVAEEPLREEIIHFLHCVRENHPPLAVGDDGLIALELANQVICQIA